MKHIHLPAMTRAEAEMLRLEDDSRVSMLEHAAHLRREAQRFLEQADAIERTYAGDASRHRFPNSDRTGEDE